MLLPMLAESVDAARFAPAPVAEIVASETWMSEATRFTPTRKSKTLAFCCVLMLIIVLRPTT